MIAVLLTIFGVAHSGLASLRAWAEEVIGARVRRREGGREGGRWGCSSEAVIAVLLTIFGVAHSGLASLRPWAEEIVRQRYVRFFLYVFLSLFLFE